LLVRLQDRVLGAADAVAGATGWLGRPFSADAMIAEARRATGLSDFGDDGFVEPLRQFLRSCATEGDLGVVGRIATTWDVNRFLCNLLRLRAAEVATPSIADEPIERPIFITGLPRSGTTFLHTLLMQDPANDVPRVWQAIYPYPDAATGQGGRDRRIATVNRQLAAFRRLAPAFASLHPLDATSPQECAEITAHVFASLRFDTNYQVPSYRDWLDRNGHLDAYRFHRRFLQHLQHQARQHQASSGQTPSGARRWVLKCPDHVFALDAVRAVYPDARIVFVHRDPLKVLASVARLTEVVRRPFTRHLDPLQLGRQESLRWHAGVERMIAACSEAQGSDQAGTAPIHHVHYLKLVADPVGTLDALYGHFGLELTPAAADGVRRQVRQKPHGGYGEHHYRFADHGLDPVDERRRFARYMDFFGITPEFGETPGGRAWAETRWRSAAIPTQTAPEQDGLRPVEVNAR
jgi:hypothetical protein